MLWWQGWDQAPPIVLKCLESWHYHHSPLEWNIILLDKNNIANFIDLNKAISEQVIKLMSIISLSDVIRWMLLYEYGGVWVDATLFCHKPLTSWLNLTYIIDNTSDCKSSEGFSSCYATDHQNEDLIAKPVTAIEATGFFSISNRLTYDLFENSDKFLMYCSFFLVSIKKGYIASRMIEAIKKYWIKRPKESFYFWQYFLFRNLYATDSKFNELWNAVDSPNQEYYYRIHYLQTELFKALNDDMRIWLCHPDVPFSKLTYKYEELNTTIQDEPTVFEYLLAYEFDNIHICNH